MIRGPKRIRSSLKLKLKTQLECIDYTAENFVHADLTLKELIERGKTKKIPLSHILKPELVKKTVMSMQQAAPQTMKQLYRSIFSRKENKDPLVVRERNIKCIEVLKEQLKDKKKLAVFFGAGHYKDMKLRVEAEGFKQKAVKWVTVYKE